MKTAEKLKRPRKSAPERVVEMLDMADAIINREHSAELHMRDVADEMGVSRALAYTYFPDKIHLVDAVMDRHVDELVAAGILRAASNGSLVERACATSEIYLNHVASKGRALEIVMREVPVARELTGRASWMRSRIYRELARAARRELQMSAHEAVALVQVLAVIPEEAAKHVRAGRLGLEEALSMNERFMKAAIEAQTPNPHPYSASYAIYAET